MKRNLAIVLAIAMVFYTLPVRAAEEPVYHFFNIGSHPVDPNRQIDPVTECRVELTEPSPTVRLSFVKNGEVGETRPGSIRSGYVIVVDKATGFAKWVSLCGNDVVEPKNWIPVGRKVCGDQPAQPERDVEAGCRQRQDRHAGGEGCVERIAGCLRGKGER